VIWLTKPYERAAGPKTGLAPLLVGCMRGMFGQVPLGDWGMRTADEKPAKRVGTPLTPLE
jgi:hypothetical protein